MRSTAINTHATVTITVDGRPVAAQVGDTVAGAMLAAGLIRFGTDPAGAPHGMFCNMGTCCQCLVTRIGDGRRLRACLLQASEGLEVATDG